MTINILKQENNSYYITGFIGSLENGVFKNVSFNNPKIYSEVEGGASIAVGYAYNDSTIENVKILNGELNAISICTGGICGKNSSQSIIQDCYNTGSVISEGSKNEVGGIVGRNTSIVKKLLQCR